MPNQHNTSKYGSTWFPAESVQALFMSVLIPFFETALHSLLTNIIQVMDSTDDCRRLSTHQYSVVFSVPHPTTLIKWLGVVSSLYSA
jgi:hypothetical protein